MGLSQSTIDEIVGNAVSYRWGIPEFQRGFVWTPQKVRDLVDSLWRGYPIGSLLLWQAGETVMPRTPGDQTQPNLWVVDGHQRTMALCLLLGRRPHWWTEDWDDLLQRHDVCFNAVDEDEPRFSLRTAAMKGPAGKRWVPVRDIVAADDEKLGGLVDNLLEELDLPRTKFGWLWRRLEGLRKVRDAAVSVVTVMLDLEDVTEIYARLNSTGTKVTGADIALALVAAQNPGWARQSFLPFLERLEDAGFDLGPNMVFRSCVAVGLGRARLNDVPRDYWKSGQLPAAWKRTEKAWKSLVQYLRHLGILSADVLPTKNALIPLVMLADRFPDGLADGKALAWLLKATESGRYGGSAVTTLEGDIRTIVQAGSCDEALGLLNESLGEWASYTANDFLTDYGDRARRLLMYLVAYDRGARDWVTKQRLGFDGIALLESFNPDWHHVFPRAYLERSGIDWWKWNYFANIVVISTSSNIRFGGKEPMAYLEKYGVDSTLLSEQLVPSEPTLLDAVRYDEFLLKRAAALADAANTYVRKLEHHSGPEGTA